jgi:glycosyltransferase involved in cell wall biosynthesis
MNSDLQLSVVVPMFNEVDNVPLLWGELEAALAKVGRRAEIIFVDDGSTDGSGEAVQALMKRDARVRLLSFEANAGLSAAFKAGYASARAPIVVTLDADLQNDPADVERLLAALESASADAAVGYRERRRDHWRKRISSRIANAIRNRVTGDRVRDSACSLRVMRRECLAAILPFSGMHRFVPTLLRLAGYRVVEVPVNHRPRGLGRSKFGIWNRALPAFLDLLVVRWMMRRTVRPRIREIATSDRQTPGAS